MMKTSLRPESFHNLPPQDSILYRYLTIDKLIDFLLEDRISLVKLNLFEDKLEGVKLEYLQLDYLSDKISKQMQEEDTSLKYIGVNINPTGINLLRR
jgi:hypothetical protein